MWARSLVEPHDRDHRLDFRDFNRPEVAAETPYLAAQLARRMHVQTPDGGWYSGYWGWIAVLEAIPQFQSLARVLRWAPFRWMGPKVYDFVARNRYRIPQWLLKICGAPRLCDEKCAVPSSARKL